MWEMEEKRVRERKRWMGKKEDIAEGDQKGMLEEMGVGNAGEKWWGGVDGRNDRKGTNVVSQKGQGKEKNEAMQQGSG